MSFVWNWWKCCFLYANNVEGWKVYLFPGTYPDYPGEEDSPCLCTIVKRECILLITPKYFPRPPSVFPGLEQVQWPGKLVTHTIRECKGGASSELTTTEVIDIFYPWYIIRRAWSIVAWKAVTTYNPSSRKYTASWVWKCCRGFSTSRPSGIKTSYPTPHRHQDNLIAEPSLLAVFRHSCPPPRSVARMTALVSLLSIFGKMLVSPNISFRKTSLPKSFSGCSSQCHATFSSATSWNFWLLSAHL